MVAPPNQAANRQHATFDWIDVLLVFVTLCGAFALAAALGASDSSRVFKYGTAAAIVVVVIARRAILGPPRVVAVTTGRSVLGLVGATSMLVGLVVASLGGYLLFTEWKRPVEVARIDRAAIEKKLDLPALRSCVRDGKQVHGRECRTLDEIAREAADDERRHAEAVAMLQGDKRSRMSRQASIAGVGVVLVLLGIALDLWRTRRDQPDESSSA